MKLVTLGIDDSAAERDIDGGKIALERVELQAFLQTDVEYSFESRDKAVGVRCVTRHIVKPDEQIEVREQRFHGGLEVGNGVHRTMQNSVRCEDTKKACGTTGILASSRREETANIHV